MSTPINKEIPALMRQLRLHGMAAAWEWQVSSGLGLSTEQRVKALLEAEQSGRESRRVERRGSAAGLDQPSAFVDSFVCYPSRGLSSKRFKALTGLSWLRENAHLVFTGATGTGKSWLACALARKAISDGYTVESWAVSDLLAEWRRSGKQACRFRRHLKRLDLLVLEKWGYEPLSDEDLHVLTRVVGDRLDTRSLVVVSSIPQSAWLGWLHRSPAGESLIDRLKYASELIELRGTSVRGQ